MKLIYIILSLLFSAVSYSDSLQVGKICQVKNDRDQDLGLLVISEFWFHSGRENASYIAADNATGIGVEIHFFNNQFGQLTKKN